MKQPPGGTGKHVDTAATHKQGKNGGTKLTNTLLPKTQQHQNNNNNDNTNTICL
jgi:hypothetical protein